MRMCTRWPFQHSISVCSPVAFANVPISDGRRLHSGGDWHAPDGTVIGDIGIDDVPGFQKSYDNHALKEHCH